MLLLLALQAVPAGQLIDEIPGFSHQCGELLDSLVCFDLGMGHEFDGLCECFEALVYSHACSPRLSHLQLRRLSRAEARATEM